MFFAAEKRLPLFLESTETALRSNEMKILYNDKTDLLYIRFDDRKQPVVNRRITDGFVLDVGENERLVGLEILDASRHVDLNKLLPVSYAQAGLKTL